MSPVRALKPCPIPGCPRLVPWGRCKLHSRDKERERGTTKERGYSGRHARWRIMVLARYPLCVDCGAISTDADHVKPLRAFEGGASNPEAWTLENGRGRCSPCNSRKAIKDKGIWP